MADRCQTRILGPLLASSQRLLSCSWTVRHCWMARRCQTRRLQIWSTSLLQGMEFLRIDGRKALEKAETVVRTASGKMARKVVIIRAHGTLKKIGRVQKSPIGTTIKTGSGRVQRKGSGMIYPRIEVLGTPERTLEGTLEGTLEESGRVAKIGVKYSGKRWRASKTGCQKL